MILKLNLFEHRQWVKSQIQRIGYNMNLQVPKVKGDSQTSIKTACKAWNSSVTKEEIEETQRKSTLTKRREIVPSVKEITKLIELTSSTWTIRSKVLMILRREDNRMFKCKKVEIQEIILSILPSTTSLIS